MAERELVVLDYDDEGNEVVGYADEEALYEMGFPRPTTLGSITVTDPVGMIDIAERAHVTKPCVANWVKRYPDFPDPVIIVSHGTKIWNWPDVVAWGHRTDRSTLFPERSI